MGFSMMILASASSCTGQLMWKLSICNNSILDLLIGFTLYGMGAVLMIIAFGMGDISILHPVLSVGFVFSTVLGALVLKEPITINKLGGITLIIAGMCFLGHSSVKGKVT